MWLLHPQIMMKRILFCLVAFCCMLSEAVQSQQAYYDSLRNLLVNNPEDSQKAITYLHYGGQFEVSNPDSAQYYYTKSWQLAERLNYKRAMGMNISYQIFLLNNRGKFREALALCERAVEIYKELNLDRDVAIAINNLGNEHQYLGELRPAIENYLQATAIAEKLKDSQLIRMFTNNVSSVFMTLKEYKKGLQYASSSYNVAVKMKDTFAMASTLVNLATAEAAEGQIPLAMKHLQDVIVFSEVVDDYTLALDGYTNMGTLYNNLGNYNEAINLFQKALQLAEKYQNPAYELVALQGLTDTYLSLKNYKEADKLAARAIKVAVETSSRNELNDLYMKAAEAKEGRRDLESALAFRKKFENLRDTLLNEQIRNNISALEVQYQSAKKDQSISEQNLALERNKVAIQRKNVQLAWSLGGVLLLLVVFLSLYRFYRQRQKLNEQRIISLQKEQEVIRLKAMIEGQDAERQRISKEMHDDVGSGLTSILYMSQNLVSGAATEQAAIAPKITRTANTLVEKMNEIIWSLNKQYDSIEDLVIYIRHSISELLDDRDMNYEFNVPDVIPERIITGEQRRNMYLVVKEAVHNAIKHSGASLITISFEFGENFVATVHDNGKGIDLEALRRFGNGLNNMKQRMTTIHGDFEITHDNGTTVKASIPLLL